MIPIRVLLVDDETPARLRLRGMLEQVEDLEIVGEARDGLEAVERIESLRPDLVFLDIEMPAMDGMQVATALSPPRPKIVFCTAFDQYAIQAFEQYATDYILKPVRRDRLHATVARVRDSLRGPRELEDAARTQERLLPQRPPDMATLDYSGTCVSARDVGGDLYDFVPLEKGCVGLVLADVSGKGVFAGLLMAGLQARIQAVSASHTGSLGEMVGEINRQTHAAIDSNRYATFFFGRYDDRTRELTYVNAGHLPPIVVRRAGANPGIERLEASGTAVGIFPDTRYREERVTLQAGDVFCMFTDGVTEATDADGREFGDARLVASLVENRHRDARELASSILDDVGRFVAHEERADDLTLVVGKVR